MPFAYRADKVGNIESWDNIESAKNFLRSLQLNTFSPPKKQESPSSCDMSPIKKHDWEIDLRKLKVNAEIGRGTFTTVYTGVYNGQPVAVKELGWSEEDDDRTALFRKVIDVWSKLEHPNVTKFIGASMGISSYVNLPMFMDNYSKACCMVVEYLQGGTLKNYLISNRVKKLPYKTVVQISLDLAKGLSYLHSKKIVHRNVKTENLLLHSDGTVKLTGFCIARVEAENMTGLSGTIYYMAPEVIDGKPYNRKCDVYSFGICLWEIYCCRMPYADLTFSEISSGVVYKNLRPTVPRCCPSPLAKIMKRCWDKNFENRPEMEQVVALLDALDTSKDGDMMPEDNKAFGCFCLALRGH